MALGYWCRKDWIIEMSIFELTLQQTYYRHGFFNVTRELDHNVRNTEGPIDLVLGDDKQLVKGHIDRKVNQNGTARIRGGAPLRDWFQANFQPLEKVRGVPWNRCAASPEAGNIKPDSPPRAPGACSH
jgi:hypothetical protein